MNGAPDLERLQSMLQDFILRGGESIEGSIALRAPPGVRDRLGIYHHAYRTRLAEALRDAFGHTARYLEEDFAPLAASYVESHASDHASLRDYGVDFPEWLAVAASTRPDLAELAALDRALRSAFDCADSPAMTLAGLAAIEADAWGRAIFVFTRSCVRLRFDHNTLAVWQAIDDGAAPPAALRLDRSVEVLVWRRGLQPNFRSLTAFEAAALDGMHAGLDFATTCERMAQSFPDADVAAEAGRLLRRWIDEELLSSIEVPAFAGTKAT